MAAVSSVSRAGLVQASLRAGHCQGPTKHPSASAGHSSPSLLATHGSARKRRAAASVASSVLGEIFGALAVGAGVFTATKLGASAYSRRSNRRGRQLSVRADSAAPSEELPEISKDYLPGAPFYKVEAVLRPWRIKYVCRALLENGIRGVTVSDARGFGAQGGSRERQAGSEFADDDLVVKSKLEVVVVYDQVEDVIDTIIKEARTGEIGDGKIFVSPVSEVIRVRTGERGIEAERMAGGRQDLLERPHVLASIDGSDQ